MASSWIVLGEIVRRVDGRHYGPYVREMIFEPCLLRASEKWTMPWALCLGRHVDRYYLMSA